MPNILGSTIDSLKEWASPGPKRSAPMAQMEESADDEYTSESASESAEEADSDEPRGVKRKADPYDVPSPEPSTEGQGLFRGIKSVITAATPNRRNSRRSVDLDADVEEAQTPTRSNGRASTSVTPVEKMATSPRKKRATAKKSMTPRLQSSAKRQKRESIKHADQVNGEQAVEGDEIGRLTGHRRAEGGNDIEIQVLWQGGDESTWEPEVNLQEDAPDILYEYWEDQGGRSQAVFHAPDAPLKDEAETYHVFRLLQFEKRGPKFFIKTQWVGYPPHEFSWEPEPKLNKIAPDVVEAFWTSKGGRDKHAATRGRGRPRKGKAKK